jgi:hypothetical protein
MLALSLGLLLSAAARADDLQGMIRIVGSEGNVKTLITDVNEFKGPQLCSGPTEKRVRQLPSMIIKVSGAWKEQPGLDKCLDITDFAVLKTANGHDLIVGSLSQKDGVYRITADDGKTMTLGYVQKSLQKLEGKKVILDLELMKSQSGQVNLTGQASPQGQANLTDTVYKALSYSEFP